MMTVRRFLAGIPAMSRTLANDIRRVSPSCRAAIQRSAWPSPSPPRPRKESPSQTNDVTTHCYLTDMGHFDNTGIYSLIERGCRYSVAVDCSADPSRCFADVGNAIRRCRIGEPRTQDTDSSCETHWMPSPVRGSRG